MRFLLLPLLLSLTACGALVGIEDINGDGQSGSSGGPPGPGGGPQGGAGGAGGQGGQGAGTAGTSGHSGAAGQQGGAAGEPGGAGQAGESGEGGAGMSGGSGQGGAGEAGQAGAGQAGAGVSGAGQGGAGMSGGSGQGGAGVGPGGQGPGGQGPGGQGPGGGGSGGGACDTIYVAPKDHGGDDLHTGCDPGSPLATIAKALEKPSKLVALCKGNHVQSGVVTISKTVVMVGGYECGDTAVDGSVITALDPGAETATVVISPSQLGTIKLQRVTIDGSQGNGLMPRAALKISDLQGQASVSVEQSRLRASKANHGVVIDLGSAAASSITLAGNLITGSAATLACQSAVSASAGVVIRGQGTLGTVSLNDNWIEGGGGTLTGTVCDASVPAVAGVHVLPSVTSLTLNLSGNVIDAGTLTKGLSAGVHASFSGKLNADKNRIYGGTASDPASATVGVLVTSPTTQPMPTTTLINNMIHGGNATDAAVTSSDGLGLLAGTAIVEHNTVFAGGNPKGGVARALHMGANVTSLTVERNDLFTPSTTSKTYGLFLDKCADNVVASTSINVFIQGAEIVAFPSGLSNCYHGITSPVVTTPEAANVLSYKKGNAATCTYVAMTDPGMDCTAAEMLLISSTAQCSQPGPACTPLAGCPGAGCMTALFPLWSTTDEGRTTLLSTMPMSAPGDLSGLGWRLSTTLPCPLLQNRFMGATQDVADDIFKANARTQYLNKRSTPGAEELAPPGGCPGQN